MSLERCPVCRARLSDSSVCRRCGADLDMLRVIDARAEWLAHRAVELIGRDDWARAEQVLHEARKLRRSSLIQALHEFVQSATDQTSTTPPVTPIVRRD